MAGTTCEKCFLTNSFHIYVCRKEGRVRIESCLSVLQSFRLRHGWMKSILLFLPDHKVQKESMLIWQKEVQENLTVFSPQESSFVIISSTWSWVNSYSCQGICPEKNIFIPYCIKQAEERLSLPILRIAGNSQLSWYPVFHQKAPEMALLIFWFYTPWTLC